MKIGNINIEKPIILAPMESITNRPFRLICKEFGADMLFTEFTSSEAITRGIDKAFNKMSFLENERPIAIQIFGRYEEAMQDAAKKAEKLNPDFIDINCGCWVKNHVSKGEGAALLKDLDRFESIVRATVKATKLPVTVKTRLGWDQSNIVILDVAKMVQDQGAAALTVHCRTRSQAFKGKADWSWLEKIRKVISIPLIANGDIVSPDDAKRMFDIGCDGVMIGRATLGNPWIFKEIRHFLDTGEYLEIPNLQEKINVCLRHLKMTVDFKGIRGGLIPFRKFYSGYFKGIPGVSKLKKDLMQINELDKIEEILLQFLEQKMKNEIHA